MAESPKARVVDHLQTWWSALVHPERAGRLVLGFEARAGFDSFLFLSITAAYFTYGFGMGVYRGIYPAIVSALKLPFLYILTLAVCVPSLYVLNCLLGPRLRLSACFRLLLLATSANAVALVSYAPVAYFFTLTTSRQGYGFLILMHVAVFGVAGIASLGVIGLVLRATAMELRLRLQPSFVMAWGVLYAFVGTQMSWILRPWVGSWSTPYRAFRPIGGSFIESVWHLLT